MTRKVKVITGTALAGVLIAAGFALAALTGHHAPSGCTFDGGGWTPNGSIARTTDGQTWLCNGDSRLVKVG